MSEGRRKGRGKQPSKTCHCDTSAQRPTEKGRDITTDGDGHANAQTILIHILPNGRRGNGRWRHRCVDESAVKGSQVPAAKERENRAVCYPSRRKEHLKL